MMITVNVDNSFCHVEGSDPKAHDLIKEILTYQNDIQAEKTALFGRMQIAKRIGNKKMLEMTKLRLKHLEASEWVCWYKDRSFPTGHLNLVKDVMDEAGIRYKVKDLRNASPKKAGLSWRRDPFPLRYYQKEMVQAGIKEGRGVFEAAVGTGKSLVLSYLVEALDVTSLVIVPSRGLLDQMNNELVRWFGARKVEMLDTKAARSRKNLKTIRICTVQTLAALRKTGDLDRVVKDVSALFVDEIHHAASASYLELLPYLNHVYYRYGFTGTFLRNDGRSLDMWGFLSNVLYRYKAHKAIEEGFLTPLEVRIYDINGRPHNNYQKEYDNNYCGNPGLLRKVYDLAAEAVEDDKQVLILVNKKDKAGLIFHEYLKAQGVENVYVSGDNRKEEITSAIEGFNSKRFQVLIGSSVIGEGIDVRSTDHLIMCQGGKSEIVMVQAIGRAVRLFEDKDIAFVHDFNFTNTRYMQKHVGQRINIYERNFQCRINTSL